MITPAEIRALHKWQDEQWAERDRQDEWLLLRLIKGLGERIDDEQEQLALHIITDRNGFPEAHPLMHEVWPEPLSDWLRLIRDSIIHLAELRESWWQVEVRWAA